MSTGIRETSNKLRWRNFPLFLIRPLIEVASFGEGKYDTFNFLKGQTILNCTDAIKRHLDKFEDPSIDDLDEESRVNHLAHVAWNALVAVYMLKTRPDLDDRYKPELKVISRLAMQEAMDKFVPPESLSEAIQNALDDPESKKKLLEIYTNERKD